MDARGAHGGGPEEPGGDGGGYNPQDRPPQEISSRICVKNMPKYADEQRLREHFSQKGEVTDAKIVRTSDGRSRCFGFVGFASADQAQSAVKYFNKSFMDAMRIEVEFAYKFGSQQGPKAWSKYTEGTSAFRRQQEATGANGVALGEREIKEKKSKKEKKLKPEEVDPKLKEFMNLMAPRSKKSIWNNDDDGTLAGSAAAPTATTAGTTAPSKEKVVLDDGDGSDDDLYEEIPAKGRKGGNHKNDVDNSDSDSDSDSDESKGDDIIDGGDAKNDADPVLRDAGVSDMDYLKSRVRKDFDDDDLEADNAGVAFEEESEEDNDEGENKEEEGVGDGKEANKKSKKKNAAGKEGDIDMDALLEEADQEDAADDKQEPAPITRDRGAADPVADPQAAIEETGRLFVRNLPYTAGESDLRTAFEAYGEVESVHIVLDKATRRSKGYAMVQFTSSGDAVEAHSALDGSIFMGRLLHVIPGRRALRNELQPEDEEDPAGVAGGGTSSYKRKKEADMKASAGNRAAWNSLFMRADTVAEAVAAHYGVTKADLLDPQAADMAVRLALGETQVIAQTKTALGEEGVNVAALEDAAAAAGRGTGSGGGGGGNASSNQSNARSDRVLLVKNLPFSSDSGELEALFSNTGPVARLVLPPTKTLALVEFYEAQDARKAFKALAYKRYQSVPIYLEWAPDNVFSAPPKKKHETPVVSAAVPAALAAKPASSEKKKQEQKVKEPAAAAAGAAAPKKHEVKKAAVKAAVEVAAELVGADVADDAVESSTIYVKNLAFGTEDEGLRQHFAGAAEGDALRSVKVARRKGKDGRLLSAGFGFVECSSEGVARDVITALQGSTLDGHRLVLQLAQQQKSGQADSAKKSNNKGMSAPPGQESNKIAVRNVAFEATRKDIMGLFTPFGEVKSCRLPRKFDGTHRGFSFVEFATWQEARDAVDAVTGTHLYGRRLVIEWASEEGGLDELRAKTAVKYRGEEAALQQRQAAPEEEEELRQGGDGGEGEGKGRRKRRKRG